MWQKLSTSGSVVLIRAKVTSELAGAEKICLDTKTSLQGVGQPSELNAVA
jgi:hypothetical protein